MKRIISNSTTGLEECACTVRFSKPDAADRTELEQFIGNVFRHTYGANIKRFMPYLMSLRDQDDQLIAVCGLRSAASEPLFLETYLDHPIETALSEQVGYKVERSDIVEVGNFSVAELGMARYLMNAIIDQLHTTSKQWAVFTIVPRLSNAFAKMGVTAEVLGEAKIERIPADMQSEWGSYYDQKPQIMAIRRIERRGVTSTNA